MDKLKIQIKENEMEEDTWMNKVEALLEAKGMTLDSFNDGWYFMFENGWTPAQAVTEMLS